MPQRNDGQWIAEFRQLQTDTLDRIREQVQAQEVQIAVIKTKIAMYSAFFGFLGSIAGAVVAFFLKK